jgi:agmatine deiminase
MPAEWEPHEATWLTWPKNKTTWPGKLLKEVQSIYFQMISALLPGEKVHLLVDDFKTARFISNHLSRKTRFTKNLIFHRIRTVDTWIRDYGPIFVVNSRLTTHDSRRKVAFTKWIFNAWGGKYKDLARDNRIVKKLSVFKKFKSFWPKIVLEGGSIDVNGQGVCLTTEQCLLNPNRNPVLLRKDIEYILRLYLGIQKVVWLKEGIEGDDTDGHVDDITRFVGPRRILTAIEFNPQDKNHSILKENFEILKNSTDQNGKKFEIISLPMPGKVRVGRNDTASNRLPASYANFYIANRVVLVPTYSHHNDKKALQIIQKAFPTRKVVGIECAALVYGLGSIHCVTQQQSK